MAGLSEIVSVLQRTWVAACPADISTQFPGMLLDAGTLKNWFEFWVTQVADSTPQRAGEHTMLLFIDVHCFSRQMETFQILMLSDLVRQTFSQQTFAVASTEGSIAGYLRIYEAVRRDLTRESTAVPKLPLQHIVVSLSGRWESS